MSALAGAVDALAHWAERALAVALLVGISLNFANVIGRYAAGFALNGVDEIEIYILIWTTFLGASIVTWHRQHLRMDVLLKAFPRVVRRAVGIIEALVLLAVFAFVAVQSFWYVKRIYTLGAVSDVAQIPTWIPHSAIAANFAIMTLIIAFRSVLIVQRKSGAQSETTGDEKSS